MKKTKKLFTSLALSALMAVQPIACYAVDEEKPETYSYTFEVSVIDLDNNQAFVGGLKARLVEYELLPYIINEPRQVGDYVRTIAEFTTSDTEPIYITCDDVNTECAYYLEIDELPENYSYLGKGYVRWYHFGDDFFTAPYDPFLIYLHNQPPYEVWEDFPITKTVDWNVSFRDYTSIALSDIPVEYIKGIDFEIARMIPDGDENFKPVETIGKWNTSGTGAITFTTEETFNSEDDEIYFGFKFNAVPEEYEESLSGYKDLEENSLSDGYYMYKKHGYSVRQRDTGFYFTLKKEGDEIITTMPTTTKPPTTTTTTTKAPSGNAVAGDANGDKELTLADAVFIMQSLSNPAEYVIAPENVESADVVNKGDGITSMDALAIQMVGVNLLNESDLPVTSEEIADLMNRKNYVP